MSAAKEIHTRLIKRLKNYITIKALGGWSAPNIIIVTPIQPAAKAIAFPGYVKIKKSITII
jgi:hypothetical protein